MKKIVTLLLVTAAIVSVLGGCTGSPGSSSANVTPGASTPAQNTKPVTLKVWQWRQEIVESFQEVMDEYTKLNPHVTIVSERPGGSQFDVTIKALMASGENPDIFAVRAWNQTKEYAIAGQVLEFTNEPFMENVTDAARATVTMDGKLYGLPMQNDGGGIIYNKKVFADVGIGNVPDNITITQLKEYAEKLKDAGIIPFAAGFKDVWTLREMFSYLQAQTTDLVQFAEDMKGDSNASIQNPKMDKAFEVIDLVGANCNEKPMDSDYNNACALMAQGKAGMMIQGLWSIPVVEKMNPDFDGGFLPVPISDVEGEARMAVDVTVVFHIYKNSENIEESKNLLNWFTTPETARMFAERCGFLPPFKDAVPPVGGGSVWNDLAANAAKGNVVPLAYALWPTGFEVQLGQLMQGYYTQQYNRSQLYTELDKAWRSFLSDK